VDGAGRRVDAGTRETHRDAGDAQVTAPYRGPVSAEAPSPTLAAFRRARAAQDAAMQRARPLSLILLAFVLLSAFRSHPGPGLQGAPLGILAALAAAAVAVLVLLGPFRLPVPARWGLTALLLAGSAVLIWLQPDGPGVFGMLAGAGIAARQLAGARGIAIVAAAAVFTGVASLFTTANHSALWLVLVWLGIAAVYSAVRSSRRVQQGDDEVERLLAELDRSRDAEVRAAALAERQRLAREMHDVLAHSLSGLAVQLEGARLLAAQDPADPRLAGTIDRAQHLARSGLEESREAIGMLRGDDLPGPDRLAALAAGFGRDSGVPCAFTVTGSERELDPATKLALYRVAQEALTNIRRHAHPERAEISLGYLADGLRLTVEDFGPGDGEAAADACPAAAPAQSRGYGLTGMAERAELLGGTLTAGPSGTGFTVELWIPR
jgi:signal transduction histidine kinase